MPTWIHDIRYALRQLGKTPGFAAMAVLTLALGMGANVTIFSLISGVLFRPFPGQREGELVRLYCRSEKPEGGYRRFSYPYYRELKEQNASFRSLSAFTFAIVGIREHDFMRRLGAGFITSDFFGTFGVHVARGRSFRPEEEAPGSRIPVAIISDRLWQRFGSDPNLVGQSIVLDNVPVTVVGVLPPAFVSASSITNWEVWLPLGMLDVFSRTPLRDGPSRLEQHGYRRLFLLGQLKPNVTPAEAQSELDILAAHLAESFPAEYRDCRLLAGPMATIKVSSAPDDDLPLSRSAEMF